MDDVRATAQALAAFHTAGRDFPSIADGQKLGPRGETDPAELFLLIDKLHPDGGEALNNYRAWTEQASQELSDDRFAALPQTLIHGDIQPANIIIDDGKVKALIDLDWCDRRPRVYDLAFAILLCCARHDQPIDGSDIWSLTQTPWVDRELTKEFFHAYAERGWPLSADEIDTLHPQVVLSWCHCRLAGAMKVEPSQRREFLERPPHDSAALFPDRMT
jgi:Ser/Thr protein kinase RdoA (MazF antagonist)